jgi:metallo-beta-lactamase class B
MVLAMSVKWIAFCALLLAGCTPVADPAPVTVTAQYNGRQLAQDCAGKDGWSDPAPPAHVYGNVYTVGTCGITSLLITSENGHILIDGATKEAAAYITHNIRKLGFKPTDVKYLLSSHEHMDHIGGLAELKRITGAQMVARTEAKASLESGQYNQTDPQKGSLPPFEAIKVDKIIVEGELVKIGALKIKALATPGHSPGGTSWTWQSCDKGNCLQFVYADSLGSVSSDIYKFTDHPEYVAIFRSSIDKVASLSPCDVLITPHPSQSRFFERLSGTEALVDTSGCKNYALAARDRLQSRLTKETSQ